jgi:hypothetical protein
MTEPEIVEWLGYTGKTNGRILNPDIAAAMADLPVPYTDEEQVTAFKVFLRAVHGSELAMALWDARKQATCYPPSELNM